jgi:hypothetical protein
MDELEKFLPPKHVSTLGGRVSGLSRRDNAMLDYIWKWKIPSTCSIHEAIGRPNTPYSTFKALERLATLGDIECLFNRRAGFQYWVLTDQGFESVRETLGSLQEEGFLSENPIHDRNVLAFHLGEWCTYRFPVVTHFSEQELRRYPLDLYPDWIPKSSDHRADGYTRIDGEKRRWLLAYEVELSAKKSYLYNSVIQFYRRSRELDRVYWLVGDPYIKEQILTAKTNVKDEQDNYHVFVDLKTFEKMGWDAPVTNLRSETLFTLRENYRGIIGNTYGEYLGNYRGIAGLSFHLDPRKVIGKSKAYASSSPS